MCHTYRVNSDMLEALAVAVIYRLASLFAIHCIGSGLGMLFRGWLISTRDLYPGICGTIPR